MWYPETKTDVPNVNAELLKLKGELSERKAKISLAKFLRHNIGFTTELISGIKLAHIKKLPCVGL